MSIDLINPLLECEAGCCPHCGNPLLIVDSEMVYMELNDNGHPIDCEVTYSRVEGVCYFCGTVVPYKRSGQKYIPYNPLFDKQVEENIKVDINKYKKENNPFIK